VQPVLAADGDRPDAVFAAVVVDLDLSAFQISRRALPLVVALPPELEWSVC